MSYEPHGIKFFHNQIGRILLLVDDPICTFDGWFAYKHPDGQWVSLKEATHNEKVMVNIYLKTGFFDAEKI